MKNAYVKFIFAMLIFGSIGLFVKLIPLPSTEIVSVRTIIGSIFLLAILLSTRRRMNKALLLRNFPILMLSGAFLGFGWVFLFEAYRYTTVSIATLVYYCAPLMVFLISSILFNEKLSRNKIVGIIAAAIGMLLINGVGIDGTDPMRGLICALVAAVLYAALMILNKFIKGLDGLEITLVQVTVSAVIMMFYVLITHKGPWVFPHGIGMVALLIVGVLHTGIACYLYFSSMQELPVQSISFFSYIDPLSALLFSAVFLSERLSFIQILGAILILGGAAFGEIYKVKDTSVEV